MQRVVGDGPSTRHAIVIRSDIAIAVVAERIVVSALLVAIGVDLPGNPAPIVIGSGEYNRGNLCRRVNGKIRSLDRAPGIEGQASEGVRVNAFRATSMYTGMAARMTQLLQENAAIVLPDFVAAM